jgi:hypothetical protein
VRCRANRQHHGMARPVPAARGGRDRGEVEGPARIARQPGQYFGMFMGGIVGENARIARTLQGAQPMRLRCGICSIGWSKARQCRSTRRIRPRAKPYCDVRADAGARSNGSTARGSTASMSRYARPMVRFHLPPTGESANSRSLVGERSGVRCPRGAPSDLQ